MSLLFTLRTAILLFILAGTIFIPWKLSNWLGFKRSRWMILGSILLFGWSIFAFRLALRETVSPLMPLYQFAMIWPGVLLYLACLTLFGLILILFIDIRRRVLASAIILMALLLSGYSLYHARHYRNIPVEIAIKDLPEAITIYHIPDVHLGPFGDEKRSQKLVEDMNRLAPDIVLINGDLIDGEIALYADALKPLKQAKVPVYFTTGNHDVSVDLPEIKRQLRQYGVEILVNDIIEIKGAQLVGLDYLYADENSRSPHRSLSDETIKTIIPKLPLDRDRPIVVAHHSPVGAEYIAAAGADLMLSGHTHGGQLFPATLFARLMYDYVNGHYRYQDMQIYVSQGVGTFGPPMRLGTHGEASLIRLVPANR